MNRTILAASLTSVVDDWLANTRQPRILHVFDRTCNLVNEHGGVLSVVTTEVGNGPFNLVIDGGLIFAEHLHVRSTVAPAPLQLKLGDFVIRTTGARRWNPHPDWSGLRAGSAGIVDCLVRLAVPDRLTGVRSAGPSANVARGVRPASVESLLSGLAAALVAGRASEASPLASKCAGLGIGLTPTGDDILLGAMHAVWIVHPPEVASVLARAIADTAAPLTTTLSAAWLQAAGRGEAGEPWHALFQATLSTDWRAERAALERILGTGHTSGADALTGFMAVLRRSIEWETPHVLSEHPG